MALPFDWLAFAAACFRQIVVVGTHGTVVALAASAALVAFVGREAHCSAVAGRAVHCSAVVGKGVHCSGVAVAAG